MSKKNESKAKGILPATDKEKAALWCKVDWEGGLAAYVLDYGPDWVLLERCGVDIEKLKKAAEVFEKAQDIVGQFEELVIDEPFNEDEDEDEESDDE